MEVKKMNTQEAIKFLRNENGDFYANDLKKVIKLLEQGEKYEQAYGELECTLLNMINFLDINQDEFMRIKRVMRNIKQKYFPKGVRKWPDK